jgi:hypothetical protein
VYGGGASVVLGTVFVKMEAETCVISGAFDILDIGDGGGESWKFGSRRRLRRERRGRTGDRGAEKCVDGFSKKEDDARCAGAGWVRVRVDM